ncbi:uncharacterized protein LOC111053401 [Nilaparvata lugens]|uniref:uncharacterized protein LOC111053401 n=1 Tax=Nilaparvata lugens TaxID=108931 RepID=UPI00193EBDC5|nr:uncharacterized protein LOC111053401 [Nilaparvata lugens]
MNIFPIFECYFIFFGIVGVIATEETGHSWSDLVKSFLHKDFYYVLGEYLYGSTISYNHPDLIHLRVGKKWEKDIGSSGHEVECERASEEDFYQFDTNFSPNLYIYSDENGVENKNILSYFTFIEREIWVCTSRLPRGVCKRALRGVGVKMKSSQPISFYRIVNVMHGIKPINKIFYFDGIEVFLDRCAVREEDDMGDHYTATFREVKYFDPSDEKVVRYKGKVFLRKDPTNTTQPSIFEPIDVSTEQPYNKQRIKIEELEFLRNGTSKTQNIGSEGRILRVGVEHYEILGSANDEAICKFTVSKQEWSCLLFQ